MKIIIMMLLLQLQQLTDIKASIFAFNIVKGFRSEK